MEGNKLKVGSYVLAWPPVSKIGAGRRLQRSEQAMLPFGINPSPFFGGSVGRVFLGYMHGPRWILPVRPQHPLQRLFDVAPLMSAQAIDRRGGLPTRHRL